MNDGRKITDLEQMESVPAGTSYLAEAGDGSGTKQLKHEKLVEEVGKGIGLGKLEELDTKEKSSIVVAVNEVNKKTGTAFEGTDGIKTGTAGVVPAPKPDEVGCVLGANGKWVPPGEGGSLDVLEDREALEANTEKGKLVDALVVKELNNSLKFPDGTQFYADMQNGKPGFNTDPERGADTFHPFNTGNTGNITQYFLVPNSKEGTYTICAPTATVDYAMQASTLGAYIKVNDVIKDQITGLGAGQNKTISGTFKATQGQVLKFKSQYPNTNIGGPATSYLTIVEEF